MEPHPFGWLSLVPPLVAIFLAILTRKTLISLLIGIGVGALLLASGDPVQAGKLTVAEFLWPKLTDGDKIRVYSFTLLTGAMIGLISASGGMRGLVNLVIPYARTRVRGQLTGWLMGLGIFFDDYANMLLLGGTLREVTDRLKISREKLAYIVDSTAAPVAGLALVSTWVATEIAYVQAGLDDVSLANKPDAFRLFVESIPYRFYSLWALLLVPMVALLRRDFGPMLAAEVRAIRGEHGSTAGKGIEPVPVTSSWLNAAIPVVTMLGVILAMLWLTGSRAVAAAGLSPTLMQVVGAADSYQALVYGSSAGLLAACLLIGPQRILSGRQFARAISAGAGSMVPALLILWLSAALAEQTGEYQLAADGSLDVYRLGTALYLKGLLATSLPIELLPTVIFLIAAAVSFSTGTSWGTMGILVPLSVSLTIGLLTVDGAALDASSPLLLSVVGSVLAGAIFGDHCSPISDTTILSSQSCGCEHTAHVRTQLPYALLGAVLSVLLGTLPVAYGVPVWICHAGGAAALIATLYLLGKDPQQVATVANTADR